jgi:O-antigen/teichoic acid export membrane protein
MNFFKTGFLLIFLSNISNVLNYGLMILISRQLTKADLSIFTSVTATGIVATSFLSVVPSIYVMVFNDMSLDRNRRDKILNQLNLWILSVSFVFYILLCIASFPVSSLLNIETPLPMLFYSACLLNSLFLQVFVGYCQGQHRYEVIQVQVFLLSLIKLFITFLLLNTFGDNIYFVFSAEFIATIFALAFLYSRLKLRIFKSKLDFSIIKKYVKKSIPVGATLFISGALLSSDIALAKHLFTPYETGDYSVASNLGKIAFFVSGAISGVVFAMTHGEISKGNNTLKVLFLAILASLACGGIVVMIAIYFPEKLILLLFGKKFLSSIDVFQMLSISMTLLSVNTIIFNYLLARSEYGYIKYAIFILALYFFTANSGLVSNSYELASLVTATMIILLVANVYSVIRVFRKGFSCQYID